MHRRVVVYATAALAVLLVAGVLTWRLIGTSTPYEQALGLLPSKTLRTTFTDWAVVRREAGGTSLGPRSPRSAVQAFLDRAYDRDLTYASGVDESTASLARLFGFSPLNARWEVLGQSRQGQVDALRLDDGVDLAAVERALQRRGYDKPRVGLGHGGVWDGGPELVARLDPDLTPLQQYVVVLPDQHLVLMSDSASYVAAAADVARGSARSVADHGDVSDLAGTVGDPVTAVQWSSTFACRDLTTGPVLFATC